MPPDPSRTDLLNTMEPLAVLLLENERGNRIGRTNLLEQHGLRVVAAYETPEAASEYLASARQRNALPDIALCDILLVRGSRDARPGLNFIFGLRSEYPSVAVVAYSENFSDHVVYSLVEAGVSCMSAQEWERIEPGIDSALTRLMKMCKDNWHCLSPGIARQFQLMLERPSFSKLFMPRQQLRAVALFLQTKSYDEVGRRMLTRPRTAYNYVNKAYRDLNIEDSPSKYGELLAKFIDLCYQYQLPYDSTADNIDELDKILGVLPSGRSGGT